MSPNCARLLAHSKYSKSEKQPEGQLVARSTLLCGFCKRVSGYAGLSWKLWAQPAKGRSLGMSDFSDYTKFHFDLQL